MATLPLLQYGKVQEAQVLLKIVVVDQTEKESASACFTVTLKKVFKLQRQLPVGEKSGHMAFNMVAKDHSAIPASIGC